MCACSFSALFNNTLGRVREDIVQFLCMHIPGHALYIFIHLFTTFHCALFHQYLQITLTKMYDVWIFNNGFACHCQLHFLQHYKLQIFFSVSHKTKVRSCIQIYYVNDHGTLLEHIFDWLSIFHHNLFISSWENHLPTLLCSQTSSPRSLVFCPPYSKQSPEFIILTSCGGAAGSNTCYRGDQAPSNHLPMSLVMSAWLNKIADVHLSEPCYGARIFLQDITWWSSLGSWSIMHLLTPKWGCGIRWRVQEPIKARVTVTRQQRWHRWQETRQRGFLPLRQSFKT